MAPRIATLISALPETTPLGHAVRNTLLALAGTAIIAVSAKIQVPFWPVPMTMQTLAIVVIAMAFGAKLGFATLALYLFEGAIGLPVFAGTPEKGIGLPYMLGPTGGYLVGFVAAAWLAGWLAEKGWDRTFLKATAVNFVATVVVFVFGLAWLVPMYGFSKSVAVGVTPFLLSSAFKIVLGGALLPAAWSLVRRLRN
ncbi:MAG: biotin transporter BioY [Alphaproteobacteria bacterium]|nr:biotin transporter BioY [Alphaproteobacteria bacterium]MBM3949825.1 biotin transporter BioY [Rhodospirillales bacterium]